MSIKMQVAEFRYWYHQVENWMEKQADWRYLDKATQGLLDGTANQDYINDEIKYAVLRWRELAKKLSYGGEKER